MLSGTAMNFVLSDPVARQLPVNLQVQLQCLPRLHESVCLRPGGLRS